jgi:hypothetical protein
MNRSDFIRRSLQTGAVLLLNPLPNFLLAQESSGPTSLDGKELMKRLVVANDAQVEKLLKSDFENRMFSRKDAHDFNTLTASYCSPGSTFYHDADIVAPLQKLLRHLLNAQAKDGTVNVGNLESPPDTAFVVELLTAAGVVLKKDNSPALAGVQSGLKTFLVGTGEALTIGGLHTPNHRWVISAALARLHSLYPNKKYVERIDSWLAEGIYINPDGNYPERSRIYSLVENTAILSMALFLNRPALLEPVRKNLQTTFYYAHPNGELASNDSRRQDQWIFIRADSVISLSITNYYLLYRHLAIRDNNAIFSAIARWIESLDDFAERILNRSLISFLEEPLLQKELPAPTPLQTNYERLFAHSHLLRIRRANTSVTFFGGADQPINIASGRSNSPDFFSYRKGDAVLKYMRLSTSFFSTGYFYSTGLKKSSNGYILSKTLSAPYYQPLPKNKQRPDGDYKLSESVDGRFWNKMDFVNRPQSNVKTLTTTVTLTETNGVVKLLFDINGQPGVPVTVELCFTEGGKLSGITADKADNSFLEKDTGKYEVGDDVIQFGPGVMKHQNITNLEGERYSTHFGSLQTAGMHVYLTGITPFSHELTFS